MTSNSDPFALEIKRLGPVAARTVSQNTMGNVVAVFEKCFYVKLDGAFICIGNSDFSDGPLNVVSSAPAQSSWSASGVQLGDRVYILNKCLHIGSRASFRLSEAETWVPEPIDPSWTSASTLKSIKDFYSVFSPSEGLMPLAIDASGTPDRFLAQAETPIAAVKDWLQKSFKAAASFTKEAPVEKLLGLGPGLTPSGDDFIGSMLITLHSMDLNETQTVLAKGVLEHAPTCTNPISAQHLCAATEGLGSIRLHHLFKALHAGQDQAQALKDLTSIGHTSGWDALAGVYTTLKIWHDATQKNGRGQSIENRCLF